MPTIDPSVLTLIENFTKEIAAAAVANANQRAQAALAEVFGRPPKRGLGRPPIQAEASVDKAPAAKSAPARKASKVSPKQARARKLQGRYLGALKGLVATDKAKVQAMAKGKGVPAALALAASLKRSK